MIAQFALPNKAARGAPRRQVITGDIAPRRNSNMPGDLCFLASQFENLPMK
jgi:hypothetical protein